MPAFLNLGTPELIIVFLFLALPVFMVISVLGNPNFNLTVKLLWIIIAFIAPVLGIVIYFSWGRNQKSANG